jgi:hypothetical protein
MRTMHYRSSAYCPLFFSILIKTRKPSLLLQSRSELKKRKKRLKKPNARNNGQPSGLAVFLNSYQERR